MNSEELYYGITMIIIAAILLVVVLIAQKAALFSAASESTKAVADQVARGIDMTSAYPTEHIETIQLAKDQVVIISEGIVVVKNIKNPGDYATSTFIKNLFPKSFVYGTEINPDSGRILICKKNGIMNICGEGNGCCQ